MNDTKTMGKADLKAFLENTRKLDALESLKSVDPSGMYGKIFDFPEQLEDAAKIGSGLDPDTEYFSGINSIVVAGMGGSAIGGDLVRSYLADKIKIPFVICRHYRLPEFVGENSLVIVSSYSGNTEETLSAFDDALNRNAKVACITTGGKLGELARARKLLTAKLPEGYPPRSALGYSFVPLLFLVSKLGFVDDVEEDITELVRGLKSYRNRYSLETEAEKNPAKSLAIWLHNKIPIIYTGPELTDAIGTRWKGQICENAKALAFNNQFPEFNHNELVGWNVIDAYRDRVVVVYLRDSDDHERIKRRMSIVMEVIEELDVKVINVLSHGDFPLGRMFSLIQIGDFASFYLAVLNNVDPTPVEVIDYLKNRLAE